MGNGLFAFDMVDFLARAIGPVDDQRQVDGAAIAFHHTIHHRDIALLDLAVHEGDGQRALHGCTTAKDHQP
jgi:hypothetical protein